MALSPKAGYLEGQLGHSLGGPFVRAELGLKPWERHAFFAYAEANQERRDAGLGWRFNFNIP